MMTDKEKLEFLYSDMGTVYCLKRDLLSSAENACSIGFYLWEINNNEVWKATDYYKNFKSSKYFTKTGVVKFTEYTFYNYCKDEFDLSRRSVDRFINIYIAFAHVNKSSGVRCKYLDEKYKDYSASQLSEMLGLSDKKLNNVSPDMTVKQIRSLKNDINDSVPEDEEPEGTFINKDAAIAPDEVDVVFDKDFEDKTFKKKKYSVCGILYDKFVSTPAQYSQQYIKLQEYLNQGYLARIVLYAPKDDKKDKGDVVNA